MKNEGFVKMQVDRQKNFKLSELCIGDGAVVSAVRLSPESRRRLFEMGMNTGAPVVCLGKGPLGDPRLYLARERIIAIRKRDAEKIECEY